MSRQAHMLQPSESRPPSPLVGDHLSPGAGDWEGGGGTWKREGLCGCTRSGRKGERLAIRFRAVDVDYKCHWGGRLGEGIERLGRRPSPRNGHWGPPFATSIRSVVDSMSTCSSSNWAKKALCLGFNTLGSTGAMVLVISDS